MIKFLKIKKLKKLKKEWCYIQCKKEYQTLNQAGKKAFPTFKEYAIQYKYQHYLNNSFIFSSLEMKIRYKCGGYTTALRSFYLHSKWEGYRTNNLNSPEYIATQIDDYIKWANAINLTQN